MDDRTTTHVSAFDALVDRGIDPDTIDEAMIQNETLAMAAETDAAQADTDTWRLEKARELFYHVEFVVDRLRKLVDDGRFHHDVEETSETIQRLNLSAKSIHHMAHPEDAAALKHLYECRGDGGSL